MNGKGTDVDGIYRFNVGRFACTVIADEEWQRDDPLKVGFANATVEEEAAAIQTYTAATGDAADSGSMNVLVIETGDHRVLVDTGNGGRLLDLLAEAGIERASIDTVILTHGHGDHILGNTDAEGKPAFTNARYVISAPEWEHWTTQPSDDHRTNLLGIADRFEQIPLEDEGIEIVAGVRALPAPGHTPGMLALLIESDGERLLHVADAYHHPIELPKPEWYFSFDDDPEQTVATRRRLHDLAAREGIPVMTYHLRFPGIGHVVADGDVWQWEHGIPS
jgi:glyoxylase-like metal-dependent hydrolase (beta-lactamase superfamily II)